MNMKTELGQAFGTRKAKKALKDMAENLLSSKGGKLDITDHAIVDSVKESSSAMATREELQAAIDQARPIPRCNLDATEVQGVYIPAQIIGDEVLQAIPVMDWIEKAKKRENLEVTSRFVARRINRVATSDGAEERVKVLRYLLYVLAFWAKTTSKSKGVKSIGKREELREVMEGAPEVVIESIRRKFSDKGMMRKPQVDLLMTHCCAFACIVDSFSLNTLDLKEDLRLEQPEMSQYFREIGAKIRQRKKGAVIEHWAELSLPLEFPQIRQPRRGKR
jgi:DNA-directed RNA polymerase I subunit RPA49